MRLPEIQSRETDCETPEEVDAEAGDTGAGTGTARLIGTADGDSTSTDDLDLRGPGRLERECWSRWIREGRRAFPRGVRSTRWLKGRLTIGRYFRNLVEIEILCMLAG
jgi:hypothetical protein